MPFPSFFDEDTPSSRASPYDRLLKIRKWVLLFSTIGILSEFGYFKWDNGPDWLQIFILTPEIILKSSTIIVLYLTLLYLLYGFQTIITYDSVLTDRFRFKRASDLEKLRSEITDTEEKIKLSRKEVESDLLSLKESYILRYEKMGDDAPDYNSPLRKDFEIDLQHARNEINRIQKEIDDLSHTPLGKAKNRDELILGQTLDSLQEEHRLISGQDPARVPFYKPVEVFIDFIKVIPIFIISTWAISIFLRSPNWIPFTSSPQ